MIAVIADDLTGAAELGGIGLRYNLQVEISTHVSANTAVDLLIINTDSRSKTEADAVEAVTEISKALKQLHPQFIYKKIDSVLRGHILPEVQAEMQVWGVQGTFIIPANPALGRTLVSGTYWVNGQPVHQTSFSSDPEFPVTSANVLHMLKAAQDKLAFKKHHEVYSNTGIIVGEVSDVRDLNSWAQKAAPYRYVVGAAGFFNALLQARVNPNEHALVEIAPFGMPALYVSGTTFANSAKAIKALKVSGGPVSYLPLINDLTPKAWQQCLHAWCEDICKLINEHGKAIMSIDQEISLDKTISALQLREGMASVVKKVFEQVNVEELVIEGGSTAAAILKCLKLNTLYPVEELAAGVIRNKALFHHKLYVTLKPGSYNWGEKIWHF
ncbi:four-carbon acid sugar kinase family protein [Mucilaginibacter lacusdianchii]|uniref:four-carbon acid sugar kinase family protein n=1 Tax=Mucilaginibacter lacusdianchii TaxID=2684211 RepID=UPI00131BB00D|nr:four-carbon acid sugar kinase family protein [Mucilaginibacter sp. JXJ CY 39]